MPVYDRLDALFGIAPDATSIATMNVLTGYIPPEFGLKSGAVIEVQSSTVPRTRWAANRFLDPVHPGNLHNEGDVFSGEAHLTVIGSERDLVRINLASGRSRYEVPTM